METDAYDFMLPEHLIAQTPLADRSASRLMTLHGQTGEIGHHLFRELPSWLQPEDVLVLNNTKVLPARRYGHKRDTGARVEVLLLKEQGDHVWEALAKPGRRLKEGTQIVFSEEPLFVAEVVGETKGGSRLMKFEFEGVFLEQLERLGHMPLPPYIKERLDDPSRYQTVYAAHEGSAAAPTAGLHFTEDLFREIKSRGTKTAELTLHVGLGTFKPVQAEHIEDHTMHSEYYQISEECIQTIHEAKSAGGRIIAVGTTSARTLEAAARASHNGELHAGSGWTDIFIYPGYSFQVVDALITNFHLPKSTLLMMISALAGYDHVMEAYREAVAQQYRFFSFGDAMFITGKGE